MANKIKGRRQARAIALQALYEIDAAGHSLEKALSGLLADETVSTESQDFARMLVSGVVQNRVQLDSQIARFAPAWPPSQLPIVDRNILRLAIFEITQAYDVPAKVAINEAVELAKRFSGPRSASFVNGVLGAVMTTIKETGANYGNCI